MALIWRRIRAIFEDQDPHSSTLNDEREALQLGALEQPTSSQRPNRPVWSRRIEFLLAAIGYAVGFGNIWRFPWLLMKNGGGAFLLPYVIMLIVEGIPLFVVELSVGQRYHLAPIPLWKKISTLSAGIGFSQYILVILGESVYFSLLGWSVYYFFASFQSPLPWSSCERADSKKLLIQGTNQTLCSKVGPTVYYWYEEALQISDSIGSDFTLNWKLALCVIATGIIITLCLIKGIKSTGKVVYFTTCFPYLVLFIFLVRGLTLQGSADGLKYLFSLNTSRLADPYVWLQASSQIFYSLSLASGGMVTYASYNPTQQDVFVDAVTISVINGLTSLIAGLAVFSLLGHRAFLLTEECKSQKTEMLTKISTLVNDTLFADHETLGMNATSGQQIEIQLWHNISRGFDIPNCGIQKILEDSPSGSGLAFITLTEVINNMQGATFFSILFFLMLITVGLDSSFGGLEGSTSSMLDSKRFYNCREEVVTVMYLAMITLLSLPFATKSGEYIMQLFNTYAIDLSLVTLAFMEIVTVAYLYGLPRFCADVKMMTGRTLGPFFKILLGIISPLVLFVLLVTTVVSFANNGGSKYQVWDKGKGELRTVLYPTLAVVTGWLQLVVAVLFLPGVALYTYFISRKKGHFEVMEENDNVKSEVFLQVG